MEESELEGITEEWRGHVLDFVNRKTREYQEWELQGPGMDTGKVNWKQMDCEYSEKEAMILGSQHGLKQE